MVEGVCSVCGIKYIGWALEQPRHRYCEKCGTALEIKTDRVRDSHPSPRMSVLKVEDEILMLLQEKGIIEAL